MSIVHAASQPTSEPGRQAGRQLPCHRCCSCHTIAANAWAADTYLHACRWCLVCQLASWFNGYCLVRTYSTCLEALLTTAGVYHWLLCQGRGGASTSSSRQQHSRQQGSPGRRLRHPHQRAWLACAALSVVFRPSSALFWTLPAVLQLLQQQGVGRLLLLWDAATVGGGLLGAAALVDRAGYGR